MKRSKYPTRSPLISGWIVCLVLTPAYTLGAPISGQFMAGSGSIAQSGATTTITQTSQNASLNWQGFNIAPNETVRFIQPSASAIAVNRIFDVNGTQILGQLQANGQIFLINPNGVLFGTGAQVNVGALVASTIDVQDSSLNSSTRSFSGNGKGSVINLGTIETARGGYVALLGNHVSNQGNITAQLGTVALGAGSAVTLSFNGNQLLHMQIDESVLNSLAANGGLIHADGGMVLMSAGARDSLLASVVNNSGIIEARTVTEQPGGIILLGGMQAGSVQLSGTLDTSAPRGGNGGAIETSAAQVCIADTARVSTAASNGHFGKWLIDPNDFTVAASSSDFNAANLSSALETASIELRSSQGAAAGSGNVNINADLNWHANSSLTLTASNNVNVNANITATGNTAGLVINPNTANGSEVASGSGTFNLQNGAAITLTGSNPSLSIAGANYTVINGVNALQTMTADPSAHFALGSNIEAADTINWNGGRGFTPIGDQSTPFTGTLDGLGHTISHLVIDQRNTGPVSANVGLVGTSDMGALIQNLGLVDASIMGGAATGGLIGSNMNGHINNSFVSGTVTGDAGTGGLIGVSTSGNISQSYHTGFVSGAADTGGLVGSLTSGAISNAYSHGDVVGNAGTGGLVGSATAVNITQSTHTGNVIGAAGTGGVVGSITSGNLSNTSNLGTVIGGAGSGGLVGSAISANVSQSYHTGTVTGAAGTGGVVGSITSGTLSNTYHTGNVIGAAGTGGLAGSVSSGAVNHSYAAGSVTGAAGTGGLVGVMSGPVTTSYWDTSVGPATSAGGGSGMSSAQMKVQANFIGWDFNHDWLMFTGSRPLLRSMMTEVSVTANSYSKTYDGLTFSGGNGVSYDHLPAGTLPAGLTFSGNSQGAVNVAGAAYVITPGGLQSNQQIHYLFIDGFLSITPFAVSLSGSRVYDGSRNILANSLTMSSLVNGDILSLSGTGILDTKDVGAGKAFSTGTLALGNTGHSLASNYSFLGGTQSADVTQAAITLSTNAVTKTYDGNLSAFGTAVVTGGSVMAGDSLSGGSFAFTDKNAGSNKTVSTTGVSVGDGAHNNNYAVTYADNTASTINTAALTISTNSVTKTYDGNLSALGTAVVTNGAVMAGDSLSGGSFAFTDKNAGSNKTVSTTGVTVGDGTHNNNYAVTYADNTASTINTAALTLSSNAVTKTYDGNLSALGTAVVTNGTVMAGDSLSGGSFAFTDKNAGTNKTVSTTGVTVGDGTHNSNYAVAYADNNASTINTAALTLSSNAVTKTYDGNLSALGTAVLTNGTVMAGDSLSGGIFAFTDKNAGSNKRVSTTGVTVGDGTHNDNYAVSYADNTSSTINMAALTLSSNTVTKTYDGNLSALGTAVVTSGSVMAGDRLSGGSFVFADKNAGSNKTVTINNVTVGDGTHNNNYAVSYADNNTSTINKAPLTFSTNAVSKVYDSNLSALGTVIITTGHLMAGDSFSGGSFAFTDKNAGNNKTVRTSGVTVGDGINNSNYAISYLDNTVSAISKLNLLVNDVSVSNKVVDGNRNAHLNGNANVHAVGNDVITVGGTGVGNFNDALVGNTKGVSVTGFTLIGTNADNYNIVQPGGLSANITPAVQTTIPAILPLTIFDVKKTAGLTGQAKSQKNEADAMLIDKTSSKDCVQVKSSLGDKLSIAQCGVKLPVKTVSSH